MSSGIEVYDDFGNILITSDMKSILAPASSSISLYSDNNPVYWLSEGVSIESGVPGRLNSLFGMRDSSGGMFLAEADKSYWIRIPDGGAFARIGSNFAGNSGYTTAIVGTNRLLNHVSGYLDVIDSNGNLTWSATSAGSVPKIQGIFSASRNSLWDKVGGASLSIPGNPFFMANALAGWSQISESSISETHAVTLYRSGDTYYLFADFYSSFMSYATAKSSFSPEGINVPYGFITGA